MISCFRYLNFKLKSSCVGGKVSANEWKYFQMFFWRGEEPSPESMGSTDPVTLHQGCRNRGTGDRCLHLSKNGKLCPLENEKYTYPYIHIYPGLWRVLFRCDTHFLACCHSTALHQDIFSALKCLCQLHGESAASSSVKALNFWNVNEFLLNCIVELLCSFLPIHTNNRPHCKPLTDEQSKWVWDGIDNDCRNETERGGGMWIVWEKIVIEND